MRIPNCRIRYYFVIATSNPKIDDNNRIDYVVPPTNDDRMISGL
jgi:hypothetical protein